MIETSTSLADLLTLLFCEGVFRSAGIVAVAWRRAGHVGSGGGPLIFFQGQFETLAERRVQSITGIRQDAAKTHTGRDGTIDFPRQPVYPGLPAV